MNNCKAHNRYNCYDYKCQQDNAGRVSVNTNGGVSIGVGGGLSIDTATGGLGINVGGITIGL